MSRKNRRKERTQNKKSELKSRLKFLVSLFDVCAYSRDWSQTKTFKRNISTTTTKYVIAKIKSNGDLVSKQSQKIQTKQLNFFKSKYLGVFCIAEQYATVKTMNIQCSSNEQFQQSKTKDF